MSNIKHLDFESAYSYLQTLEPRFKSQDLLAQELGCSKVNVSLRKKEGRFLVSWLQKLKDSGWNIDIQKFISNCDPYIEKDKPFRKATVAKNYWFYDRHPRKVSDPDDPMHRYSKKFFSDLVAVKQKYLAEKHATGGDTFLMIDIYGSMAPRVLPTDVLLVQSCGDVEIDGLYVIDKGGDLKVVEIKQDNTASSDSSSTFYTVSQSMPEYSETKKFEDLKRVLVGRVIFKITEQV